MSDDVTRNQQDTETPAAGITGPGEYTPAGEAQGQFETFSAARVAEAFGVEIGRVRNAMQGEFELGPGETVDSKQAQTLAEVLLGDRPLDQQQAALMQLGAFTPRTDHEWGSGETAPGEESDRLVRSGDSNDEERGFDERERPSGQGA
ncbi:MAG TPA: hypothetical protein VD789_04200 [Thermomicrobiales bacterium]|nr:hypothetical protein [Thermomicrobiales bacterium]